MAGPKKKPMMVREPIQIYLDRTERSQLDVLAKELEVSRGEVLRRGLEALRKSTPKSFYEAFEPLIGSMNAPDLPTDLSRNFKKYYVDALEKKWKHGRRSS